MLVEVVGIYTKCLFYLQCIGIYCYLRLTLNHNNWLRYLVLMEALFKTLRYTDMTSTVLHNYLFVFLIYQTVGYVLSLMINFPGLMVRISPMEKFGHETDVSDGQPQRFDSRQTFFVSKRWHLKFLIHIRSSKCLTPTFRLSLSKASFKLNILLLSLMLAALRWAMVATLRLGFFWDWWEELLPELVLFKRLLTNPAHCWRCHTKKYLLMFKAQVSYFWNLPNSGLNAERMSGYPERGAGWPFMQWWGSHRLP